MSGFVPGQEIAIRFVGLRPGEKLHEELVGEDEITEPAAIDKILRIQPSFPLAFEAFREKERVLEAAAHVDNAEWALEQLQDIVPTFRTSHTAESSLELTPTELLDEEALPPG